MYTIFCSFLVFFYTDVIGVNAAAVGTIILISRIFDGFSDIIAGNIVEHTHAKRAALPVRGFCASPFPSASPYIAMCTVPDCGEVGQADLHFSFPITSFRALSTPWQTPQ